MWRKLLLLFKTNTPHDFSCGSDEVCYCEKAPDCIKKQGSSL